MGLLLSVMGMLRYHYAMSRFIENTVAEAGFAASWARYVAPVLDQRAAWSLRWGLFASLVTGLAAGLAVVTLMMHDRAALASIPASIMGNPLFVALLLALCALCVIASWMFVLRRDLRLADAVELAVETHFAALFRADGNDGFADVIIQDLAADGVLEDADYRIVSNHAGAYRDCRIRLITAQTKPAAAGLSRVFARRRGLWRDLVVARMSLPGRMEGAIHIDSAPDKLPASFGRFHADHDGFDGVFRIACTNRVAAADLLTPGLADMLMAIRRRLVAAPRAGGKGKIRVAARIEDASLVLVIEQPPRAQPLDRLNAAGADALARDQIMRFATVPGLIDALYGDGESVPVFASLSGQSTAPGHETVQGTVHGGLRVAV